MKNVTFDELIDILDKHYPSGALIKICEKDEHAIQFLKGEICMGSLELYRKEFEDNNSDRNDPYDGVSDSHSYKYINSCGKKVERVTTCFATGLILCLFRYNNDQKSVKNLRIQLSKKGSSIAVFPYYDKEKIRTLIRKSTFAQIIYSNTDAPVLFVHKTVKCRDVTYIKGHIDDWSCKNEKFSTEQEFRYASSEKGFITNLDANTLKILIKFKCQRSIEGETFHVSLV